MAQKIVVPRRVYHFLQSPKTAAGFEKMRTRGAAPPPFQSIQVAAEIVRRAYIETVDEIQKEVMMASAQTGARIAGVSDADELSQHLIAALRERIKRALGESPVSQKMLGMLSRQFLDAQEQYFTELQEDADEETKARVLMALTKDDVFRDRLEMIRRGYLKSAVERISEGQSDIRKRFIAMFEQWIEGRRPDLDGFEAVMDKARKEAGTFSAFFARDQFSRFNRALTVATYDEAGAKWIKWVTVGDGRVRSTHRSLNGKIFAINDLPKEYLDYMCRCAMLPVYDLKGMRVTRGDGIALAA